jgi:hypothetical protein
MKENQIRVRNGYFDYEFKDILVCKIIV